MQISALILDYLRVLLSAPVMVAAVIVYFLIFFRADIKALMSRIATIKFPGGELSTSQMNKERDELLSARKGLPSIPEQSTPIPQGLSPEQIQVVKELIDAERAKAFLWEYRYLNYYLAPSTQRVLDWLASLNQRTTVSTFDTFWQPVIPNAQERIAILTALQTHHLIQITGELIEVTPKGREYLQWRRPLPA